MLIDEISLNIVRKLNEQKYIGGRVQKNAALQCELNKILIALNEAIGRPAGVVPACADEFYSQEYKSKAL